MIRVLMGVFFALVLGGMATAANAAMVYTNQADFDAAVASLLLHWSEDFEGFAAGTNAGSSLSIAGGQAVVSPAGSILAQSVTHEGTTETNTAYHNNSGTPTIASGFEEIAFSFNYTIGGPGDQSDAAIFASDMGFYYENILESPISYPGGEFWPRDNTGFIQFVPMFFGWIGDPGEVMHMVTLNQPGTGILLDNFRAFAPVPLPAAIWLFLAGLGAFGAAASRRRRGGELAARTADEPGAASPSVADCAPLNPGYPPPASRSPAACPRTS
jgi:hypothetical protein